MCSCFHIPYTLESPLSAVFLEQFDCECNNPINNKRWLHHTSGRQSASSREDRDPEIGRQQKRSISFYLFINGFYVFLMTEWSTQAFRCHCASVLEQMAIIHTWLVTLSFLTSPYLLRCPANIKLHRLCSGDFFFFLPNNPIISTSNLCISLILTMAIKLRASDALATFNLSV